jgi:hypothetical protein
MPRIVGVMAKKASRVSKTREVWLRLAPIVYPQITRISADLDMCRTEKGTESAEICVICG